MSDIKKLDERINNLESKLKDAFKEINSKISGLSAADNAGIEERFQELEDLILLLQVEQMKIREKMHAAADIGFGGEYISPEDTGNMKAIVNSLQNLVHDIDARLSDVENKRHDIESKIPVIEKISLPVTQPGRSLFAEVNKILNEN